LPPIPAGQTPSGEWLLFSYLKYAEEVSAAYRQDDQETPEVTTPEALRAELVAAQTGDGVLGDPQAQPAPQEQTPPPVPTPDVRKRPTRTPSVFAESLAEKLSTAHQVGSDVYWNNDGFMVDLSLRNPKTGDPAALGLLCDATRFANVEDPVEWDVFRTGIHESQGWRLHRVWTPHFFRDPKGVTNAILRQM
jgi:hypothetical protein